MTGRATLTTEPSIKAMLDPRMVATSTQTPTCGVQGRAWGAERMTPSSQGDFTKVAMCVPFLVPETDRYVSWFFQNGCSCVSRFPLYHLFGTCQSSRMLFSSTSSPKLTEFHIFAYFHL